VGPHRLPDQARLHLSPWQRLPNAGGRITTKASRFLQYRLEMTSSTGKAPILTAIGFTHNGTPLPNEDGPG
jgi:hypothetical protein